MRNRLQYLRRAGLATVSALVLGAAGCALPNGVTGGDPILGNFNRPICPTPPPERGGLGLDSPAYDAGVRIGVAPPDILTPVESTGARLSSPQLPAPSPVSGARLPLGAGFDDSHLAQRPVGPTGARLPSPHDVPISRPSSDLAFVPPEPATAIRPVRFESSKDPSKVQSLEEGQAMLRAAGANGQKLEQTRSGEWVFACTVDIRYFEASAPDPVAAIKAVLEQIQIDR